jgi:pyruvate,water dikinase
MHDHYIYGNQNAVELYGQRAPFVVRNLEELRAVIPTLRDQYWWVQELPVAWMRDLDQYLIQIGEFMAEPLESKSIRELWSFVLHINEFGANYFLPNIAISITHATLYRLLHLLLQRITGPNAESMFDKLMAFCETRTGVINKELFELALLARNDAELQQALFSRGSREFIEDGMLERFPAFSARFQKFLRAHGHREMDFDAYAPTWNEVPWIVLDNVQLILKTPMDKAPADKELDLKIAMQQAELELFQKLPQDLHFFFAELLRLARLYTSLDDLEHYQTTRLTPVVRRALREMGSRLVEAGVLSEPMDVFFAHLKQLDDAVAADTNLAWQNLATIVRAQKADYLRDKAQKPSWVLGEASEKGEFSGELLSGLPGSPGIAEGPVYMVKGPEDFANFPKGAVLVARTTNPTWTPLFYSAIAVVTESGGPLSHGAVTAREMSLPAVMSVKDSLLRLRNGQIVRVDGNHGTVSIVQ